MSYALCLFCLLSCPLTASRSAFFLSLVYSLVLTRFPTCGCVLPHPCFIACVSVSMSVSVSVCGDATDPLPPPRDYPPPVLVRVVVRAPSLVRLAFTRVRLAVRRAAPAPHLPAGRLPSRPQLAVVPRVCVKWRWGPAKPPHPRRRRGKAAWASSAVRLTLYSRAGIRCVPSLVSRARASAGTRWGTCAAAVEREGRSCTNRTSRPAAQCRMMVPFGREKGGERGCGIETSNQCFDEQDLTRFY